MRDLIDLSKLADLRERHARLQETYRGTAERARILAKDVARLIAECASEADAEAGAAILSKSPHELAAVPVDVLTKARLDPRAVRRIVAAQQAAAKQRHTAEALALELRASVVLMERVNEYASRFETIV